MKSLSKVASAILLVLAIVSYTSANEAMVTVTVFIIPSLSSVNQPAIIGDAVSPADTSTAPPDSVPQAKITVGDALSHADTLTVYDNYIPQAKITYISPELTSNSVSLQPLFIGTL